MKLAKQLLDWCCSDPGFPASFVQYYKALYNVPKVIWKEYRLWCNAQNILKLLNMDYGTMSEH